MTFRATIQRLARASMHPLVQVAAMLATLPWLISPGVMQPDTKIDLIVSPWRYLSRSLDAWSRHSGFGELQNQAYGYLFPMGPFFGVLHSAGVPGWAAQRAWWSLLLVVGFVGAALVARRVLGLARRGAGIAGVSFALSPRVLSLLSELSVETWPGMLLPWFVLAVHRAGIERRSIVFAAHVGLLTACLGGVNATASLVPVLGGGVYALLTVRTRRLVVAYAVGTLLGAAWWLGPLVVLGGYAYPFMDFIETSRITTAVTTLPAILRGASDWVAYIVDADGHPVWQSGWVVAQGTVSIVCSTALAGIALAGLVSAHRRVGGHAGLRVVTSPVVAFTVMLGLGVVGMGAGYAGTVSGLWADDVRGLLDTSLAPARNVHKLDPLVRLPLVLGLGHVVDRLRKAALSGARAALVALVALVLLMLGALAPLLTGRVADSGGFSQWPISLRQAATAIDSDASRDGGTTLVLPSARSAHFTWGTTGDEPLTAFAQSPIAVRASAPLYHPGAQRLVDDIDLRVAQRRGVDEAIAAASRAGISRIVVRSGLDASQQTTEPQAYVAALAGSAMVTHHRTFGSGAARYDLFTLAANDHSAPSRKVSVLGGPESAATLLGVGVSPTAAFMTGERGGWITDDVRLREYNNGRPPALAFGPTLVAGDPAPERLGSRDLDYPGRRASLSVLALAGVDSVSARSSTADPFARTYLGPGTGPAAAIDGSPVTRWLTPLDAPSGLELFWRRGSVSLALDITTAGSGGARVESLAAVADGKALPAARRSDGVWRVTVGAGTRHLELRPVAGGGETAGGVAAAVGIADISTVDEGSPGARLAASVRLPGSVDTGASGVVMTRSHPFATGRPLAGEDDGPWRRQIVVGHGGTMNVTVNVKDGAAAKGTYVTIVGSGGAPATGVSAASSGSSQVQIPTGVVNLELSPEVERVTLTPTSEEARARLGLSVGRASAIGTGPVAVTDQGANPGWRMRPDVMTPVAVDGWRQGFDGTAGNTYVEFAPEHWHRSSLGFGAGCALACGLVLAVGRRRGLRPGIAEEPAWRERRRADVPTGSQTQEARGEVGESPQDPGGHRLCRPRLFRGLTCAGLVVTVLALLGWWALPVALAAYAVPARARLWALVVPMLCTGPAMVSLGVVAKGSLGASLGQLLTGFTLLVFTFAMCDVPTGWRVTRRSDDSGSRRRDSR